MFGVWQATFTKFPFLRDQWRQNCEEERLLGVSLTGIMDHPPEQRQRQDEKVAVGDESHGHRMRQRSSVSVSVST
jgi:hypothetical protein